MNVVIFSLLSMVILIPIIYFIPLKITTKGKLIIVAASLGISLICGLLTKLFLSLWQSILLIIALVMLLTLILSKRFSSFFVNKSETTEATMMKEDEEDEIVTKEAQWLHPEEKSELPFLGEQQADDLHAHSIHDKGLNQDALLFEDHEKSPEFELELLDSFNREESPLYDIKPFNSNDEEKDRVNTLEQKDKAIFTDDILNNENVSIKKDELLAGENEWLDNLDVMEPFNLNSEEKDRLNTDIDQQDQSNLTKDVLNDENFSIQKDELPAVENGWLDNLDVMVVDEAELSSSIDNNLESVQDDKNPSDRSTSYLSELEKVMLSENSLEEDSKDNTELIIDEDMLVNVDELEMLLKNHPQLEANEQVAVLLETPEDIEGNSTLESLEIIEEPTAFETLEGIEEFSNLETLEVIEEISKPETLESKEEPTAFETLESKEEPTAFETLEAIEEPAVFETLKNIDDQSILETLEDIIEPSVTEHRENTKEVSVLENEEDNIDDFILEEEEKDGVSERTESPTAETEKKDYHPIPLVEQEDVEVDLQETVVNEETENTLIGEVPEHLPIDHETDDSTDMTAEDDNVLSQTEEQIGLNEQQKQVFQTMLVQADISKKTLEPDQYEQMLISFLSNKLPAVEQYTLSLLLAEHYIKIKNEQLLLQLLGQMEDEFSHFPILLQEIHYLQEQYVKK
ncbi:hypothetical protein [Niallia endozanthoxylica]|uniref:Uncharacterized protein n=1 Tax=Niallia endozanthoxylica TaxID=2036016 RepID=A0A5J5HNU7_9BACI|nr:hypothetical protein [Niallia endozanthoxylica]KAA9023141.1 hypothetical protein F4V44_13655 [Niallia endozanthoxylica]